MLYLDHMVSERTLSPRPPDRTGAAALPDFLCESLRRSGGVARIISIGLHGHGVRLALHAQHAVQHAPRLAAPRRGIVLYRSRPILARRSVFAQRTFATPARPEEIGRFAVFLMAVEVAISMFVGSQERADTVPGGGWRWRDTGAPYQ